MSEPVKDSVLSVSDISLSYFSEPVLGGVSFQVSKADSLAIMGRSGSGKSTILSCILGLLRPDAGDIRVSGVFVDARRGSAMARLRREKIGMIFQGGELLPELSPFENVLIAGLLGGQNATNAAERAGELLDRLSVPRSDARTIGQYSGGEQQRVAVARALVNSPELVLADEPTGSLDTETRDEVVELLRSLPNQFGCALVVVTHDPVVAAGCQRQAHLADGLLVETLSEQPV